MRASPHPRTPQSCRSLDFGGATEEPPSTMRVTFQSLTSYKRKLNTAKGGGVEVDSTLSIKCVQTGNIKSKQLHSFVKRHMLEQRIERLCEPRLLNINRFIARKTSQITQKRTCKITFKCLLLVYVQRKHLGCQRQSPSVFYVRNMRSITLVLQFLAASLDVLHRYSRVFTIV